MTEYLFHNDASASNNPTSQASHTADMAQRMRHIIAGELLGTTVAVGTVVVGRNVPLGIKAAEKADAFFAEHLAGLFNISSEEGLRELGRKSTNTALIQLGGLTNVGAQYKLLRDSHKEGDSRPFYVDVAQVGLGRIIGSLGAASMVGVAEAKAAQTLREAEGVLDGAINLLRSEEGIAQGAFKIGRDTTLSETLLNNVMQSAGGIPTNTMTQHLFDRVIGSGYSKGMD